MTQTHCQPVPSWDPAESAAGKGCQGDKLASFVKQTMNAGGLRVPRECAPEVQDAVERIAEASRHSDEASGDLLGVGGDKEVEEEEVDREDLRPPPDAADRTESSNESSDLATDEEDEDELDPAAFTRLLQQMQQAVGGQRDPGGFNPPRRPKAPVSLPRGSATTPKERVPVDSSKETFNRLVQKLEQAQRAGAFSLTDAHSTVSDIRALHHLFHPEDM